MCHVVCLLNLLLKCIKKKNQIVAFSACKSCGSVDRGPLCGSGVVFVVKAEKIRYLAEACNVEAAMPDKDAWLEMVSAVVTLNRDEKENLKTFCLKQSPRSFPLRIMFRKHLLNFVCGY